MKYFHVGRFNFLTDIRVLRQRLVSVNICSVVGFLGVKLMYVLATVA